MRIYKPFYRLWLLLLALIPSLLIWHSCSDHTPVLRERTSFNRAWKFILEDSAQFSRPDWDDGEWRSLDLPHDWSIEGDFSPDHPAGIGGGALPGGIAWYRKSFSIAPADSLRKIFVSFDGIYQNSEVYLNGELLGRRPNGYIGFQYELNPYLRYGQEANVLAVRVNNSDQPNSRWYSGSGIYRNVWLEKSHPIHIPIWGSYVHSHILASGQAGVDVETTILNQWDRDAILDVETCIRDREGRLIATRRDELRLRQGEKGLLNQSLVLPEPRLWSTEDPYLYRAISTIHFGKEMIDHYETCFGIRSFRFDPEAGFFLNGQAMKILGLCMHHDLGALGAAVHPRAMERQLEILRDMGCNAIRTAHNPPAPELLDLCDRMGFLVMNETFDMWRLKKTENDYSLYWDEWHRRDLQDHLLRDRNHPCLFSWSIGNEVLEQWDSTGTEIARELASMVKALAPGLVVTAACNDPRPGNFVIRSGALDLIGYNYQHGKYERFPQDFPGQCFIATETTSSLHTRGSYDMPSDSIRVWPLRWDIPFYDGNADQSCSAYDNCHVPWGSTHRAAWELIKTCDYLPGLFIWTGFDYLGEPTPYQWPSRSSYFGIVDLAGFPKDIYYMYQSEWTDQDVLHLFPHWNWEEGQQVDIWAYSSYPEVELFINGKSQGRKSKSEEDLHLQWKTRFEPGSLKAVGRKPDGSMKEVEIHTAGVPARIELKADRKVLTADRMDLVFVRAHILDQEGHPVPHAENPVRFKISGPAFLAGVDNGHQLSHDSFRGSSIPAFHGKCLAIIRASDKEGHVLLQASSGGLETASLEFSIRKVKEP